MGKGIHSMKIRKHYLISLLIYLCILTGCGKKEMITETKIDIATGPVLNNGGSYVSYQGDIYYRQYDGKDYADVTTTYDGVLGYGISYSPRTDAVSDMMVLRKDGSMDKLFSDTGNDAIYILDNRMFMEKAIGSKTIIYSVKLDGSDKKDLGMGRICGFDELSHTIIYRKTDTEDQYINIGRIDTKTLEVSDIILEHLYRSFLTIDNDYLYYLAQIDYKRDIKGNIVICKVKLDGTGETVLVDTKEGLYQEPMVEYTTIPCAQLVDDTLYFTYGGYDVTGENYDGGVLAKVNTDGTGFEVFSIRYPDDFPMVSSVDTSHLIGENIQVTQENGKTKIYFALAFTEAETMHRFCYNVDTGETTTSQVYPFQRGVIYQSYERYYVHLDSDTDDTLLLPTIPYQLLGEGEDMYGSIDKIQIVGDQVFYRLQQSKYLREQSEEDISVYQRVKTMVVHQTIGTENCKILYQYER